MDLGGPCANGKGLELRKTIAKRFDNETSEAKNHAFGVAAEIKKTKTQNTSLPHQNGDEMVGLPR